MITIRASEDELDISGSPKELRKLKVALKSLKDKQSFRVTANMKTNPKPFDYVLCAFEAFASGGPVRVSVSNHALRVTGSAEMLEVFASFFDFSDGTLPGTHTHHDWWPGNKDVAPDSRPLVVSVV